MRRLTKDQLRPSVMTWYTVPQPLGHRRIIVCDVLRPSGRVDSYQEVFISLETFNTMDKAWRADLLAFAVKQVSQI